jgi:hypothetical protein
VFHKEKPEKPSKKKLAKIKIPEKHRKTLEALAKDELELLDLTNGELGDALTLQVC